LDLHTNTPGQIAIQRYLAQGKLESHLSLVRQTYARKMALMHEALSAHCGNQLEWQPPNGGYYVWCRLTEALSAHELMLELFREGVAILPGEAFYPGSEGSGWFRLNFTFPPQDQIVEGVRRLGLVLNRLRKRAKTQVRKKPSQTRPLV
jgi:DNA-binding transcriptional MocR family regulator